MSFNVHLLLHLPDLVYDLGPLWITSCFPLEDLLGKMLKYVHGTRYIGLQIYSKLAHRISISNFVSNLDKESTVKKFCLKLKIIGKRVASTREITEKTFALGKLKRLNDVPNDIMYIFNAIGIDLQPHTNVL